LLLLLCAATTQVEENVGQQIFDEAVMERLGELEEDGLLIVEGQSPDEVLAGLFEAALEQNLTNVKNVQRMKLNVAEGRNTVEKYVDTWSTVLSKALDRVQKRRKERRKARKDEKEQLQVGSRQTGKWLSCVRAPPAVLLAADRSIATAAAAASLPACRGLCAAGGKASGQGRRAARGAAASLNG
jgi:hypothetical protein